VERISFGSLEQRRRKKKLKVCLRTVAEANLLGGESVFL
jgi:hypothetical protein